MKNLNALTAAAVSTLLSTTLATSAFADSKINHTGPYIGAGYGLVKADGADEFDDDSGVTKFYLGGKLSQSIALEGGYIDFGDFGGSGASAEVNGYTLALRVGIPVSNRITVYGVGGQLWWDADINVVGLNADIDGSELFYGVGGVLAVSDSLDLRLEYTNFQVEFETNEVGVLAQIDNTDVDLNYVNMAVQLSF